MDEEDTIPTTHAAWTDAPDPAKLRQVRLVAGGFAYDTATAILVHHWDWLDHASPDADQGPVVRGEIVETLYRTKRYRRTEERYFLVSQNDHLEPWDKGYQEAEAFTRAQAIDWACKRCQHLVEKQFGKLPEPGQAAPYMRIG